MLKAELGDILYYLIFVVVILAGFLEKIAKAKRQRTEIPTPQHPEDDFEDVEHHQAPPQTLEEIMRRMMQTVEAPQQEEMVSYPEETKSLEYIPTSGRHFYHPEEIRIREQSEIEAFASSVMEEQTEASEIHEFEFDIRHAIIASEILNRKY